MRRGNFIGEGFRIPSIKSINIILTSPPIPILILILIPIRVYSRPLAVLPLRFSICIPPIPMRKSGRENCIHHLSDPAVPAFNHYVC